MLLKYKNSVVNITRKISDPINRIPAVRVVLLDKLE